jgi:hypothetical protein
MKQLWKTRVQETKIKWIPDDLDIASIGDKCM